MGWLTFSLGDRRQDGYDSTLPAPMVRWERFVISLTKHALEVLRKVTQKLA